jgi:hypothetical protein
MSDIQRYDLGQDEDYVCYCEMVEWPTGPYVLFADADADKKAAISGLVGLYSDTIRELLDEATERDKRITYLQNDNADRYTKIKRAEERVKELEGEATCQFCGGKKDLCGTCTPRPTTTIEALTAALTACRKALDEIAAFDYRTAAVTGAAYKMVGIAQAALKEAKPKPSILDHEDISGDNLLGG